MKNKAFLISFGILISSFSFAQGGGNSGGNNGNSANTPADTNANSQASLRWKLNGNQIQGTEFIGTTNQKDLVFKSGGVEGLRINPSKEMEIPGQINMLLHRPLNPGEKRFLTIDYNGKVESMQKSGLIDAIYSTPCKETTVGGNTTYSPIWASVPGVLWTGDVCAPAKVGINTNSPVTTFDLRGGAYISGSTVIGGPATSQSTSMLLVKQDVPNRNALTVDFTSSSTSTSGIGIQTLMNNDTKTAFSVFNSLSNSEVYSVKGDGSMFNTSVTTGSVTTNLLTGLASSDADKVFVVRNQTYTGQSDVFRVYGNGVVWATEVNIKLRNNFPDYVFDSTYQLLPLPQLESYINSNNHLPNVPSAETVKEEGINVSEMQVIQMEKIEELTLYIIEQQKLIEALKKRLEEVETTLESK